MRVLESGFLESSLKEHGDFQNTNRDDHVQSRWDAGGVPEEQPRLPAILPLRPRTGSDVGPGGRRCQCQGNRRQARTRGRDPLVHAVRESVIEIWLESCGPRAHVPRPILQLRVQQVLNAALVRGVGNRQAGRSTHFVQFAPAAFASANPPMSLNSPTFVEMAHRIV